MSYCKSCGSKLKPNASFCTQCGSAATASFKTNKAQIHTIKNKKKSNKIFNYIFKFLLFAALVFGAYTLFNGNNIDETTVDIDISGVYYDPSGVYFGSPTTTINIEKKKDIFISEHKDLDFTMELTPMGSSNFVAEIVYKRVPADFEVHFYQDEKKLTFFNSLTKNSWYLKKK